MTAFLAAGLGMALEALGRFAWDGPYLPELLAEKFFAVIPVWAFTPLFRTFGYNSKYYAFGAMIAVEALSLTLVGVAIRKWMRHRHETGWRMRWLAATIAGSLAVLILIGLPSLLGPAVAGQTLSDRPWTALPTVVAFVTAYVSALTWRVHR